MRLVFMGTPEIALPSLCALHKAGHEILAVITQPDRPRGRGHKMEQPPVKLLAVELGIPVLQFEKLRREEGVNALKALAPDIAVTCAFGQILSRKLLAIPALGTVNVHASLLPKYRGSAPIQWAIYNGERKTGITTMMTDAGIDTGDMLLAEELEIGENETAGELSGRLGELGARLIVRTLDMLGRGELERVPQNESESTYFPMLKREDSALDFRRGAAQLVDHVRAFDPWPGTYMVIDGEKYKIGALRRADGSGAPGEALVCDKRRGLVIACGDGAVEVLKIQAPSGKMMDVKSFLNGKAVEITHVEIPEGSI